MFNKRRHEKDQKKSPQPATLFKKKLCLRYFPVNFAKFCENTYSYRTHPVAASKIWKIVKPITLQIIFFFREVTGNRVSDYYAINVYIKVFF